MSIRHWVVLVAISLAALIAWFKIQVPDSVAAKPSWCYCSHLVYDEYDLAAMALRGLNAHQGRQAGREDQPAENWFDPFPSDAESQPPLQPRYFLEYPHAALLIFRTGYAVQPSARNLNVPASILDCDYHRLVNSAQATPEQHELWAIMARAMHVYAGVMVVCLFLLMAVLWRGYGGELRGGAWLLVLPAALYFTLNRYDILPALLTATCFACLGRGWRGASALALGFAVLIKVYPILFAPLILRYMWPQRRDAVRWGAIFAVTGMLAFTPMLAGADWTAVFAPYKFQLSRPAEVSSGLTIYNFFLPTELAEGTLGKVFRLGTLSLVVLAMIYRPIVSLESVLRRGAIILLVFVSLAVFYSPQWILWLVPLVGPLLAKDRRLIRTFVALDVVTYLMFPVWFWVVPFALQEALTPIAPHLPAALDADHLMKWIPIGANWILRGARFLLIGIMIWQLKPRGAFARASR